MWTEFVGNSLCNKHTQTVGQIRYVNCLSDSLSGILTLHKCPPQGHLWQRLVSVGQISYVNCLAYSFCGILTSQALPHHGGGGHLWQRVVEWVGSVMLIVWPTTLFVKCWLHKPSPTTMGASLTKTNRVGQISYANCFADSFVGMLNMKKSVNRHCGILMMSHSLQCWVITCVKPIH